MGGGLDSMRWKNGAWVVALVVLWGCQGELSMASDPGGPDDTGGGLPATPDHSCAINAAALAGRNISTFKVRSAAGAASNASFEYFALKDAEGTTLHDEGQLAVQGPFIEPTASDGVTAEIIAGSTDKYLEFQHNGDASDHTEYTLTIAQDTEVDLLIVGGGGAGGSGIGGGGGAGGVVYVENFVLTGGQHYIVRVGNGGINPVSTNSKPQQIKVQGISGENSGIYDSTGTTPVEYAQHDATFDLIGFGGGGGGAYGGSGDLTVTQPHSGGSSGGPGTGETSISSGDITRDDSVKALQPNTIWNGTSFDPGGHLGGSTGVRVYGGAGGGGAGGPGESGQDQDHAGDGGDGIVISITGTARGYAAGGGGSTDKSDGTHVGEGYGGKVNIDGIDQILGGNGLAYKTYTYTDPTRTPVPGGNGTIHTGSGGGSGGWDFKEQLAGHGGSGVVIVRYRMDAA